METAVTPCRLQVAVTERSQTLLLRFQLNARGTSLPVLLSVDQAVHLIASLAAALHELAPVLEEAVTEPDRQAAGN